jgi:hypothetical protein
VLRSGLVLLLAACTTPWRPLFDGRSLDGLLVTDFGGQGAVHVTDGALVLDQGSPLTGVTIVRELPAGDYELELTAARLLGSDFFCGLTFPVGTDGSDCLTLVLGGWGGSVCGLSSLDGDDAAHNDTRRTRHFELGRPYRVHLQVAGDRVRATVDGEVLVDCDLRGRALSLRAEVEPSRPFGICSFATRAAIRDLRWRPR